MSQPDRDEPRRFRLGRDLQTGALIAYQVSGPRLQAEDITEVVDIKQVVESREPFPSDDQRLSFDTPDRTSSRMPPEAITTPSPSDEDEIARLKDALRLAAEDLHKAANQFAGLVPDGVNADRFTEKAKRAEAVLDAVSSHRDDEARERKDSDA